MPVEYYADAWFTLSLLRAAGDGHVPPFGRIEVAELGAPFGASWNDFIRQHKPQYWLAGRLVRWAGLFPAANLLVLLAAVLAALSFYAVARYFKARPEWAFAGACAFALSPFFFYRSLTHLTLAFDWPIPLAILVVSWAFGRRGLPPGSRRFGLALLVVLVAGFHNVYFAGLFAQFLGLACLAQWLVRRAGRPALGALALALLLPLTVAADNANLLLQQRAPGAGRHRAASLRQPRAIRAQAARARCCRSAAAGSCLGARPDRSTRAPRSSRESWAPSTWASEESSPCSRSRERALARRSPARNGPCPPPPSRSRGRSRTPSSEA